MDLEGHTHIRSMNVGRYIHKYKGFYEKFTFSKSTKGENDHNKGAYASLVEICPSILFLTL